MTSDVENLALEHWRAMRADMTEIKLKVDELAGSYDAIVRLDRRVERIEKRLELVEA